MECLDDAELQDLVEGTLRPEDAARIDAHVDQCPACFALVADLVAAVGTADSISANPIEHSEAISRAPHKDTEAITEHVDVGRRYVLETLVGVGGMGQVHRALDRLTRKKVALKRVALGGYAESRTKGEARRRQALAAEFHTLATLRHPNIISVFDYGFDAGGTPFFTMELLAEAAPLLPFAGSLSREGRIALLVELLRALEYLHRRGVVHGDIKPSNILVVQTNAGPSIRLVDFGLSTTTERAHRSRAAGTLPYMAPELFHGHLPSPASDLFAVGVLVCEVLEGYHPFRKGDRPSDLVGSVLKNQPDLDRVPLALRRLLAHALAKEPAQRIADCQSFLRALVSAEGTTLPKEAATTVDSFLIAARFTGREAELAALEEALEQASRLGRGASFLIGGESGVGKSRLLEELRSRALVSGMLVVRGQALEAGGSAYQVWQGILSVLALSMELLPLEASVLAAVLPDLPTLLGREIVPPAELARARLLRVLCDVILRFDKPLCVLVEDLQWADADSLALLAQVSAEASDKPFVLLATHRDDETVGLSARLPAMREVKLQRFDRPGVAALCASMLGAQGRDERLVELVARETEGNTLFVVEALRALAEESGGLFGIGQKGLPERILAGGIEQVLHRRLSRVPLEARRFLLLAAAGGRELDVELLSLMEPAVEAHLRACADVGVLEVRDERFRFSHDKLVAHALDGLEAKARAALHAEIADRMEAAYPGSSSHASRLAYHLREANQLARASAAFVRAGDVAFARGAPGEALVHFEQARSIGQAIGAPLLEQAQVWRGITQASFGLGRLSETDRALRQLCELVGAPLPEGGVAFGKELCAALARRIAHRTGLSRLPRFSTLAAWEPARRRLMEELLLGLSAQETYVWLMRPDLLVLCTLWGLHLEEALGRRDRTHFRAAMAFILAHTPLRALAARYLAESAPAIEPGSLAEVHHLRILAVMALEEGRFAESAEVAARAAEKARAYKDDLALADCLLQLHAARNGLDDFAGGLEACVELERIAIRIQNPRYAVLAGLGQALAWLRFDDLEQCESLLARCRADLSHDLGPLPEVFVLSMSGVSAALRSEPEQAEAYAFRAASAFGQIQSTIADLRHVLVCMLEVWLSTPASVQRNAPRIRLALERLRGVALVYSFTEPLSLLYEGRFALAQGDTAKAAKLFRKSAKRAEKTGSRYERGLALYWLARVAERPEGARYVEERPCAYDERALALFEAVGATHEAKRVRAAQSRSMPSQARRA